MRFSVQHDLYLLTEVRAINPWNVIKNHEKWVEIAYNVTKAINNPSKVVCYRRAKDRTKLLMDAYKKGDIDSLKKCVVVKCCC